MNLAQTQPETMPVEPQPAFTFRSAYSKFSLVLLAITVVTLLPHYNKLLDESVSVPWPVTVHAIIFLGWYILFSLQSSLAGAGQMGLHRKLGYWSIALTVILAVSGAALMIGVMTSIEPSWSAELIRSRTSFVWAIFHTLVSFVLFYSLAIAYRARPQTHKRFMLLAALSMMSASITRVAFLPGVPVEGTALTLLSTYALLITPLVIDQVQRKRVHPVLKWGVPGYAITQILCIGLIPSTELGRTLAFPFA